MSEHLQVCSLLDPSSHQRRSRPPRWLADRLGTAARGRLGWLADTALAEWLLPAAHAG
jgi:hypothetical protein